MGTEPKAKRDERIREDVAAGADVLGSLARTALAVGAPAAAFGWTLWRVPFAWVGKTPADLVYSIAKTHPGAIFYKVGKQRPGIPTTPPPDGVRVNVSVRKYDGTLPGIGDRITFGDEFKVTPFSDKLLYAARTELRDDLIVAMGPLMVLATMAIEIGTLEKSAVIATWGTAQIAAVELADFQDERIEFEAWTADNKALAGRGYLDVYRLSWLDRIGFSAQSPLIVSMLVNRALGLLERD